MKLNTSEEYSAYFCKVIIKILYHNRQNSQFNINTLKSVVEKLMFSDKIEIMCNAWPLYFVFDMLLNYSQSSCYIEGKNILFII